jgi:hypothetical protein
MTSVDDTKDAYDIHPEDMVPLFPEDFSYGDRLGWSDPWAYNLGVQLFKLLYNDTKYNFFDMKWFSWWVFSTRSD